MLAVVFSASLIVGAGQAGAADVVVYETSEAITPPTRTAPLLGSAKIDSPLCTVVDVLGLGGASCTVTGTGSADVPSGANVNGTLMVVVEAGALGLGDTNPADAPEIVVTAAAFQAPGITPLPLPAGTPKGLRKKLEALGLPILLGIDGIVAIDYFNEQICAAVGGCPLRLTFKGTFRLPFAVRGDNDNNSVVERARRNQAAFYLTDTGQLIPVKFDERAIGYATPRLEVTFTGLAP